MRIMQFMLRAFIAKRFSLLASTQQAARMSKSFAHSLLLQGRQCLRNGTDDKPST